MANATVTLEDVANLAGVSKSTASRILAASQAKRWSFASQTRQRVSDAAAKLGYRPSKLARGLSLSKTGIIGLVIPSLTDSFFPVVASAIETALAEKGYSVILANTNGQAQPERAKVEDLLSWRVDGLIVAAGPGDGRRGPVLGALAAQNPVRPDRPGISANALWQRDDCRRRGCRPGGGAPLGPGAPDGSPWPADPSIYPLAGSVATATGPPCCGTASCPIRSMPWKCLRRKRADAALASLLAGTPRPDAVFCVSDAVAIGILEACSAQGVRVPQDLAVVGFADLPHSGLLKVGLTTVRQPCQQLGQRAARNAHPLPGARRLARASGPARGASGAGIDCRREKNRERRRLMSPRERVMAAIDHQATDRVPADLWAEEEVWQRLIRDLGARNRDDILEQFNIDLRVRLAGLSARCYFQRRQAEYVGRTLDDGQHALGHELGARQRRCAARFRAWKRSRPLTGLPATTSTTPSLAQQCTATTAMRSSSATPTSSNGRGWS